MTLRIDPAEIRRIIEADLARQKPTPAPAAQPRQAGPAISATSQAWRVDGVIYKGAACTVDLAKTLLGNGRGKTQDEWAEYSKQAKQNGEFYVGDMPLYHAVFAALSKSKNRDAEDARSWLKTKMHEKWLTTLTRIKYNPSGTDEVLHNFRMDDQYVLKSIVVGPDEWISNSKDVRYLEAILGTADVREINAVYQWLNGKDAFVWRVNQKPRSIEERVARFDAVVGGSGLGCSWDPRDAYSSLGVRRVAPIGAALGRGI